jgi:lipid A 3-O-deacylase
MHHSSWRWPRLWPERGLAVQNRSPFRPLAGLLAFISFVAFGRPANAGQPETNPAGGGFSLVLENDMFFNTDRYYTNGVSMAITTADSIVPDDAWKVIRRPLGLGRSKKDENTDQVHQAYGIELAQMMATPRTILIAAPQPNDRPWAGLLYLAPSYHLETSNRLYTFKLMLGVVGPWSLAAEAQDTIHRWRGFARPKGWANQIPNEVVGDAAYEERRRYRLLGGREFWSMEFISSVGYKVGTIEDSARVGCELRAGYRLPADFGSTLIGSAGNIPGAWGGLRRSWLADLGAHLFAGATGTGVARQVMLDGTLFHQSPSIPHEPFVSRLVWGGALTADHFRLAYQGVLNSREFKGQPDVQRFGSLSATLYW